jgi:dCMP deaminase
MRPCKDTVMLQIAKVLASLGTCRKLQVGCVLVDVRYRITGTGFNGVPRGLQHCIDVACAGAALPKGSDTCIGIHAEQNALLTCRDPEQIYACYTTHAPCLRCTKTLLNTSCQFIIYQNTEYEAPAKALWESTGRVWQQA